MSFQPVTILACGMMTGVGLTAPASCAAIRARLDNFQETRFIARGGEWIVGSEVPLDEPWRGLPRLARLVAGPVRECLDAVPGAELADLPLLLCVAEPDRPGRLDGLGQPLYDAMAELLQGRYHPASMLFEQGRVGAASALFHAAQLIHEQRVPRVLVAGVDSLLLAGTLRELDAQGRLLTPTNSNGFIPGEAGAALLVGPAGAGPGLACGGLGFAVEPATIMSEEPLRGEGLMRAFRDALTMAGLEMNRIGYRLSSLSGEQYWFKEADLATSRLLRGRHEFMEFLHPADSLGETGAAALPCMLAMALTAALKGWAPGDPVLAFASNDDNRRVALVLRAEGTA